MHFLGRLISVSSPVFDSHENVSLTICHDQFWAGQVTVLHDKNFNVAIFSDTINVINVKLCMMVLLIKLYQFIVLSVTITTFESHGSVKQIKLKRLYSYRI